MSLDTSTDKVALVLHAVDIEPRDRFGVPVTVSRGGVPETPLPAFQGLREARPRCGRAQSVPCRAASCACRKSVDEVIDPSSLLLGSTKNVHR